MGLNAVSTRLHRQLQPKRIALFEACLIGLVAALAAVLLKYGVGWVGGWRVQVASVLPAWIALPMIGLIGGLGSGWLIERVAPETAGSGVPQVKAVLARIPLTLDLRVALVKLISATFAIGSGLVLGREGPTIQVGAALAAQLSKWFPTSPEYRRQLIAAGASAGLAAAFNTPITGVLFVVEALIQDVSSFTLGTGVLAAFIGAVVSRLLGGQIINVNSALLPPQVYFHAIEIPIYILIGVLAGGAGALFNRGIMASLQINRDWLRFGLPWRMGLAGLISGITIAFLSLEFRDSTSLRGILVAGNAAWQFTAIAFVVHFGLTLVAYGAGAPGGLSAPSLILGSALGYLVGILTQNVFGVGDPITCSLVGMGAFFCAVARTPISAVIIVFELTTEFDMVLPLMIVSVTSYLVAEKLYSGSIYEHLLAWKGWSLEKEVSLEGAWANLTAANVMQQNVETLTVQMTLDEAVKAFAQSHHRGFPVLENGKLVGILTQTDLANASQRQLGGTSWIREVMTPQPITVKSDEKLTDVLYLLNRYHLSRLPVLDGRKLVGIITRSDIIRAESDCLSGGRSATGSVREPSYVVYQTCAPAIGQGRILVPLSNPYTAASLLQIAGAIARDLHYEVECLHIIPVSRDRSPAETYVNSQASRHLLRRAQQLGRNWQIPMHTQARVAHDTAQAILETIQERRIDMLLMGWKGSTFTPGRIFGNTVDIVIRQAACPVVLVKLKHHVGLSLLDPELDLEKTNDSPKATNFPEESVISPLKAKLTIDRWLVPIGGGPNAQQALQLLPGLVSLSDAPEIRLCQVFQPSQTNHDTSILDADTNFLSQKLGRHASGRITASSVCSKSVATAVLDLAHSYRSEAIVLGASREGIFQHALKGNIPEEIVAHSNCTVILVRGALNSPKH